MVEIAETPRRLYQGQLLTEAEIEVKREYGRDRGNAIRRGTWRGHRAPGPTREPTEAEVAWAAGFFQGEGNLRRDGRTASAVQVEREPLAALQEMFGGSLAQRHPPSAQKGHSPYWHWAVCGDNCRAFVAAIYPWLTGAKRERAAQLRGGDSTAGSVQQ